MYDGRTGANIFGHKNLGIVEKIGSGGTDIKVGDRVAMPFNICCGHYRNCEEQYTGFYTNVNPSFAGGAYDYVGMRPYMEGQAEYLGVPYADFNVLKLSNTDNLHEKDFVLLIDLFPTGWGGVAQSGFKPGETIVIFGPIPVGLIAAYSAKLQGASKYYY